MFASCSLPSRSPSASRGDENENADFRIPHDNEIVREAYSGVRGKRIMIGMGDDQFEALAQHTENRKGGPRTDAQTDCMLWV
jgi:hypothetical protein